VEKLTDFQLVKKFPAFYGTRKFITTFTSDRHLSLSWTSSIQSITPHPTAWRSIVILSSHLRLGLPSGLFPHQNTIYYQYYYYYYYYYCYDMTTQFWALGSSIFFPRLSGLITISPTLLPLPVLYHLWSLRLTTPSPHPFWFLSSSTNAHFSFAFLEVSIRWSGYRRRVWKLV